ncbi:MAG: hypothetical protein R3Y15_07350 [Rikenellaceae bacterium]
MKKNKLFTFIFALLISLFSLDCYAQPGGGGGGGGPRGGGGGGPEGGGRGREESTVDLVASAGLFSFNINEGIESAKLTDKQKISDVIKLYAGYQNAVNATAAECADDIKALRVAERTVESSQQQGDYFAVSDVMKSVSENIENIKSRMTIVHFELMTDVGNILDPKERKRWEAYYQKLCRESGFKLENKRIKGLREDEEGRGR